MKVLYAHRTHTCCSHNLVMHKTVHGLYVFVLADDNKIVCEHCSYVLCVMHPTGL